MEDLALQRGYPNLGGEISLRVHPFSTERGLISRNLWKNAVLSVCMQEVGLGILGCERDRGTNPISFRCSFEGKFDVVLLT